ncbi:conserved protein of unknown function [Xenorhabdus bovienii]|uniref:Uncharacterized protein n=1 Tax=Xenorhabdus bovienii TaxID=40576 RepID=A0A0B6X871_XENBV|nr:conserved protein of unknown function [Xenorhabdus bovienii]
MPKGVELMAGNTLIGGLRRIRMTVVMDVSNRQAAIIQYHYRRCFAV